MTIELDRVRAVLREVDALVDELDGLELDDRRELDVTATKVERSDRARVNQALNLLADRLGLAAALVRTEYWYGKGEPDPLAPRRRRTGGGGR